MWNKLVRILFLLLTILLVSSGCSDLSVGGKIESITLICNERIEACHNAYYENHEVFKKFVDAMESAKKMKGVLDYEEEFTMTIRYTNKTERQFHLSLTTNRDYAGLILELPDTMQGYSIPVSKANMLRDLIYEDS